MGASYHRADVQDAVGGTKRCPQCWRTLPWPGAFLGRRGRPVLHCTECQAQKAAYHKAWVEASRRAPRRGVPVPRRNARHCVWCGKVLAAGAPTRYCSTRCAAADAEDRRPRRD